MNDISLQHFLSRLEQGGLEVTELFGAAGQLGGEDAAALYIAWLGHNPSHPLLCAVLFNLSTVQASLGNRPQAAEALRLAIQFNPDFYPPYINRGNLLEGAGDRLGAIAQWQALVDRLTSVTRETLEFKMSALKQIGRVFALADIDDQAERSLKTCIDLDGGHREVLQHWLNLRQRRCRWPLWAPLTSAEHIRAMEEMAPLSIASYRDDPMWHLATAADFAAKEIGRPTGILPDRGLSGGRLRIGYLSSDLCEHAVGFLTAGIFALHDREAVELYVYYNGRPGPDRIQDRIKASVENWRDITGLPDDDAAGMMAEDRIDILVDLNGHTKDARLRVLARNPAPIIVNWLGFPGTLGTAFHHYIIADDFIIPPEYEPFYSETVLRLPCYQPTDRQRQVAETPTREACGLPQDAMVYCCFNEPRKITEETWKNWMRILLQVPGSVLWLLVAAESTQAHLRELAAASDIDPDRLIFASRRDNPSHLARYPLADLILDSFPYGAHTTASDALWMGVPVATRAGRSFASRVCGSLLSAAGLEELVCHDDDAFVALAVAIGKDPERRQALRQGLAERRDSCLLFDTPHLVRHLEGLYRRMAEDFTAGKRPRPELGNLSTYLKIAIELDQAGAAAPFDPELYRAKLREFAAFTPLIPDRRFWPGS